MTYHGIRPKIIQYKFGKLLHEPQYKAPDILSNKVNLT